MDSASGFRRTAAGLAVSAGLVLLQALHGGAASAADAHLAGRVVVKLRQTVTEPADVVVSQGGTFRGATADGSDSLDRLNARHRVRHVRSLLGSGQPSGERLGTRALEQRRLAASRRLAAIWRRNQSRMGRSVAMPAVPDLTDVYVLELPADADVVDAAAAYAADPHVEWAEPDYLAYALAEPLPSVPVIPDDSFVEDPTNTGFWREGSWGLAIPDLWGLRRVKAIEAWNLLADPIGDAGRGVLVAVVDSGVDYLHPDLAANVWTNPGEIPGNGMDDDGNGFVDDVRGWDFTTTTSGCGGPKSRDNDPIDDNGHGTHVSGTIAATADNGRGVAGIAPAARILAVKALDGGGCAPVSDLAAGIVYAADNGATVMNFSFGGPIGTSVLRDAVAYAHGLGAVMVAAAGNAGLDLVVHPTAPASFDQVITVSAFNPVDGITFFSNYGQRIDVAAPGGGFATPPPDYKSHWNILSLRATGATFDGQATVAGEYLRLAGTSMATPHAAGVAALVRARRPALTNEDVRQVLHVSADDVGPAGFDSDAGAGIVDAERALGIASVPLVRIDTPAWGQGVKRNPPAVIAGTAAGPGFASYEVLVGMGNPPGPLVSIAGPSAVPVVSGTLAEWDASDLGAFPPGWATIVLRVSDTLGQSFEARRSVVLLYPAAADALPGWPAAADPDGVHDVLVGDLGFGPGNEVVSGGFTVLQGWSTQGQPLFSVPLPSGGGDSEAFPPTLADVDGDGYLEVLAASGAGIHLVSGGVSRMIATDRQSETPIVVDDLDGDGAPRIISMDYERRIWVRDATGAVLPGWPVTLAPLAMPVGIAESIATGDLDGDGTKELVVALEYTVYVLDRDGTLRWTYPTGRTAIAGDLSRESDLVLGDVDGDGGLDVVMFGIGRLAVGSAINKTSFVVVLNHAGGLQAEWTMPFEEVDTIPAGPQLSLADLDRDGDLEILLPALSLDDVSRKYVYAWHDRGQPVAGFPILIPESESSAGMLAADVSGDGRPDLVSSLGIEHNLNVNRIYAWSAAGAALAGWPRWLVPLSPFWQTRVRNLTWPTTNLVDLDGDGMLDLLAVTGTSDVHAIRLGVPAAPTSFDWPVFRHDVAHTGRFGANPCGNGVLDAGEECDDGNRRPCDGCSGTCHPDVVLPCGDGVVSPQCGEDCDDGNVASGDCCDSACHYERVGAACQPDVDQCTAERCNGAGFCLHDPIPGCFAFVGIETTRMKLRGGTGATTRKFVFASTPRGDPGGLLPPAAGYLGEPTTYGATLRVINTAGGADDVRLWLVPAGWWPIGGNDLRGWRYTAVDAQDPIRSLRLKPGYLAIRGGGPTWAYTLDEASQGRVGLRLEFGIATPVVRFCAEAPARSGARYDHQNRFDSVSRAPAPAVCPGD